MKPIKQFIIGSTYFFNIYSDYQCKDIDELCIMDSFPLKIKTNVLNMKKNNKDVFFYRNMDKDGFINDTLESNVSMRVGKFLIPEFCEFIGFTIDDLKTFNDIFNKIDDKHKYEKLIYDSYVQNGDFVLTDEQRLKAYEEYKKARNNK